MMNFKTFFKDKKNLAITILSVLLIASFSNQDNQSQSYPKQRIRLNSLAKMSNKPNQT
jgi:hypothetical protein